MKPSAKLNKLIENISKSPGVYRFIDKEGTVLYVGKAINLNKRVKSYYQQFDRNSVRIQKLVSQIADISTTVVGSELEAILLETNLIKQLRPKYNILMKDDKNFVYIKITKNEDFPQINIVRKVENDGALYFGPKTAAGKVRKTLDVLKKIFPYRHCNLFLEQKDGVVKVSKNTIKYPCLDYHIKRCIGPCVGNCTKEEYAEIINQIIRFLKGNTDEIITGLAIQMQKAAADKKFEKAAKLRDKLHAIQEISERQIVSAPNREDMDAIQFISQLGKVFFTLFMIRDGKLINQENFVFNATDGDGKNSDNDEILEAFLTQYYECATDFPKEILISNENSDDKYDMLENWISEKACKKITIISPQKGEKKKILDLALNNVKNFIKQNQARWQSDEARKKKALSEIKEALGLKKDPKRIECFDISHLGGTDQVASMVVFENGAPEKKHYKRFKIKTVEEGKPDDFAAMLEVIKRRCLYLVNSKTDIVLKVQKNIATGLINKKQVGTGEILNLENLSIIKSIKFKSKNKDIQKQFIQALAIKAKKNRVYIECKKEILNTCEKLGFQQLKKLPEEIKLKKGCEYLLLNKSKYKEDKGFSVEPDLILIDGGKGQLSQGIKVLKELGLNIQLVAIAKKFENLFVPGKKDPIILQKDSEGIYLLRQIRDESHRFAIEYNRNLRSKSMFK
jgi:excinuclease ABC subunit C